MKRRALVIAGLLAALGCLQASIVGQRGITNFQAPAIVSPQGPRIHPESALIRPDARLTSRTSIAILRPSSKGILTELKMPFHWLGESREGGGVRRAQ